LRQTEIDELQSIETRQTFGSTEPQEPTAIADDFVDCVAGKALRNRERLNSEALGQSRKHEQQHQ
jgi:hypothetical protein